MLLCGEGFPCSLAWLIATICFIFHHFNYIYRAINHLNSLIPNYERLNSWTSNCCERNYDLTEMFDYCNQSSPPSNDKHNHQVSLDWPLYSCQPRSSLNTYRTSKCITMTYAFGNFPRSSVQTNEIMCCRFSIAITTLHSNYGNVNFLFELNKYLSFEYHQSSNLPRNFNKSFIERPEWICVVCMKHSNNFVTIAYQFWLGYSELVSSYTSYIRVCHFLWHLQYPVRQRYSLNFDRF